MCNKIAEDIYSATIQKLAFWPFSSADKAEKKEVKIPYYVDNRFVDEKTGYPLPSFKSIKQLEGIDDYNWIKWMAKDRAWDKYRKLNNIPYRDILDNEDGKLDDYLDMEDDFKDNVDIYTYLDEKELPSPSEVSRYLGKRDKPFYEGQTPLLEEPYDPSIHWWRDPSNPSDITKSDQSYFNKNIFTILE